MAALADQMTVTHAEEFKSQRFTTAYIGASLHAYLLLSECCYEY